MQHCAHGQAAAGCGRVEQSHCAATRLVSTDPAFVLISLIIVLCCRCVLELHAIALKKSEGGGEFAVAMTAEERQRFMRGIAIDHGEYYKMLGSVNAEKSECSRPVDRDIIHAGIRDSVGFGKLSRMLFGVMEEWMEGQLRAQVAASAGGREQKSSMMWTTTLANVLAQQGKHGDALVLYERVLKARRQFLPEDDPDIGETDRC